MKLLKQFFKHPEMAHDNFEKTAVKIAALGDFATVISGYAFKSAEFLEQGIPVIKIANIGVGIVDISVAQCVSPDNLHLLRPKYQVHPKDILISLTGSQITQPNSVVGRVARQSSNAPIAFLNQRAGKVIVNDPDRCDADYLYWALLNRETRHLIAAMAHGAASQANVSPSQVESLKIRLPPFHVQRRIASILSAYDDLIENNTRRIAILEEMVRRIYEEWFVRFRFPGHEGARMVESELGLVPQGWERCPIDKFGEVITGKTPSKANPDFYGDDVPFVKTPDMHGQAFVLESGESLSLAGAKSQAKKMLPPGSLCVSCIGTIGVVSITTEPCQTNQQINSIVLRDVVAREFLFLRLKDAKKTLENLGANGATMGNVNKSNFAAMEFTTPPMNLLARFHEVVEPMFDLILALARKNKNLRTTRDLLLPKLISGELDVSTLEELADHELHQKVLARMEERAQAIEVDIDNI